MRNQLRNVPFLESKTLCTGVKVNAQIAQHTIRSFVIGTTTGKKVSRHQLVYFPSLQMSCSSVTMQPYFVYEICVPGKAVQAAPG